MSEISRPRTQGNQTAVPLYKAPRIGEATTEVNPKTGEVRERKVTPIWGGFMFVAGEIIAVSSADTSALEVAKKARKEKHVRSLLQMSQDELREHARELLFEHMQGHSKEGLSQLIREFVYVQTPNDGGAWLKRVQVLRTEERLSASNASDDLIYMAGVGAKRLTALVEAAYTMDDPHGVESLIGILEEMGTAPIESGEQTTIKGISILELASLFEEYDLPILDIPQKQEGKQKKRRKKKGKRTKRAERYHASYRHDLVSDVSAALTILALKGIHVPDSTNTVLPELPDSNRYIGEHFRTNEPIDPRMVQSVLGDQTLLYRLPGSQLNAGDSIMGRGGLIAERRFRNPEHGTGGPYAGPVVISMSLQENGQIVTGMGLEDFPLGHARVIADTIAMILEEGSVRNYIETNTFSSETPFSLLQTIAAKALLETRLDRIPRAWAIERRRIQKEKIEVLRRPAGDILFLRYNPDILEKAPDKYRRIVANAINEKKEGTETEGVLLLPQEIAKITELLYLGEPEADIKVAQALSDANLGSLIGIGARELKASIDTRYSDIGLEAISYKQGPGGTIELHFKMFGQSIPAVIDQEGDIHLPLGFSAKAATILKSVAISHLITIQEKRMSSSSGRGEGEGDFPNEKQRGGIRAPHLRAERIGAIPDLEGEVTIRDGRNLIEVPRGQATSQTFAYTLREMNEALIETMLDPANLDSLRKTQPRLAKIVEIILGRISSKDIVAEGEVTTDKEGRMVITDPTLLERFGDPVRRGQIEAFLYELGLDESQVDKFFDKNIAPFFISFVPETPFEGPARPLRISGVGAADLVKGIVERIRDSQQEP